MRPGRGILGRRVRLSLDPTREWIVKAFYPACTVGGVPIQARYDLATIYKGKTILVCLKRGDFKFVRGIFTE